MRSFIEVYRPVWTPDGSALLFETYLPYDAVASRTGAAPVPSISVAPRSTLMESPSAGKYSPARQIRLVSYGDEQQVTRPRSDARGRRWRR